MLDPPPNTLPIENGIERPFTSGFGSPWKFQSRSEPMLAGHCSARITLATSSSPPASTSKTLTSGFSASRRATTDPDEPAPQTTKS
jgi:hypothetical protein